VSTVSKMTSKPTLEIGKDYVADIGNIAHGGHFVTHIDGCVVFVRGALTGEQALVRITHKRQKVYFGIAQEIMKASEFRVIPSCQSSQLCGGCDFQFIYPPHQRALKTSVLKESLHRFAALTQAEVDRVVGTGVRAIGAPSGLGWRERARFEWDQGWQMHEYRSDSMVDTPKCTTISTELGQELIRLEGAGGLQPGEYTFAQGAEGVSVLGPSGHVSGPHSVSRHFGDTIWESSPREFWQSNAALLPEVTESIRASGALSSGATWWDLYAGSGVFSQLLVQEVGNAGSVTSVEGNRNASHLARDRFAQATDTDVAAVRVINSSVESFVGHMRKVNVRPDGVFLDPPRSGAGISVCEALLDISPEWILYLACDPVALARDTKVLCASGDYELRSVTAWDAFPMTHHFESLAVFVNIKVS
jgi:tRNA/tmRNA/rRNA uracil-C5-methylase (TrmA/RlmC/RlmD family)